jgi:hypothetical protein
MSRAKLMSWEGAPYYRWVKMHKGVRYRVSCHDLGVPERHWTQEATQALANQWWEQKLAQINGDDGRYDRLMAQTLGRILAGEDKDQVYLDAARQALGEERFKSIQENAAARVDTIIDGPPAGQSIDEAVAKFLELKSKKKPKTYKELQEVLSLLKGWWAGITVSQIAEGEVEDIFKKIDSLDIQPITKKKRWAICKRFIAYLAETHRIETPRNLHSRLLKFQVSPRKIRTWDKATVRKALAELPGRLQLYGYLAINCGMTNCDIGELTKDMVKDGYLTRKRVKTAQHEDVPTVSYRLWAETLKLLAKYKSVHPTLWLTSKSGTKLLENRLDPDGTVKQKDLIYLQWKRKAKNCPIPLSKFRSVGTALLGDGPYRGVTLHYLGHSPKTVKDIFYEPPSQRVFDKALDWLHEQLFPMKR